MKSINHKQLFNSHFTENDSKYADELFYSPQQEAFIHRQVACYSGIDGTCQCNSHETYNDEKISPIKALELLKSWGIELEANIDRVKTRRRIEDALRKSNSVATLLAIANLLNIEPAILPERFLMISEPANNCWRCTELPEETAIFCQSCQYAYWSDREEATNFDCPHSTGIKEIEARSNPDYALAVKVADER